MTANQFKRCVETLRWSQVTIAEQLDVPPLMVRQWSSGLRPIPDYVGNWISTISGEIATVCQRHPAPIRPVQR
jgi:hypothetical protein